MRRIGWRNPARPPGLHRYGWSAGPRGLDAHTIKSILLEGVFELGHGFLVRLVGELFNGKQTANCVRRIRQLRQQHCLGQRERRFRQQGVLRVQAHYFRSGNQREIKILSQFADRHITIDSTEFAFKSDGQRKIEQQHPLTERLFLPDRNLRQFGEFVPSVVYLQLRIMSVIQPLVEELVKGLARQLLNHRAQIFRRDIPVAVPLQIGFDAPAIKVFAQLRTQHVEHPGTLGISQIPEHLGRLVEIPAHDRVGVVGHARDTPRISIQVIQHGVMSVLIAIEQNLVIRRKTFVQPDVAPVFAGHEITKPLMRHFMRHQWLAAAKVLRGFRKKRRIGQRRRARVFHSAGDKIIHTNLVIFCPRKWHPDFLLKKRHDGLGLAK